MIKLNLTGLSEEELILKMKAPKNWKESILSIDSNVTRYEAKKEIYNQRAQAILEKIMHSYEDQPKKEDWKRIQKCKTCGCVKLTGFSGFPVFTRSGHVMNHSPECFDMEVENKKTID